MPHYFYNQEVNSFTQSSLPTATASKGVVVYLSDVGVNGSFWISNGVNWNAVNNEYIVKSSQVDINSDGTTTEAILDQAFFPAGSLKVGDSIEYDILIQKTGTVDTVTQRSRFGPLGTVADPNRLTLAQPTTTARNIRVIESWIILNATTLRHVAAQGTLSYGSSATAVADTTIDITVGNYLSLATLMTTGGIETATLHKFIVRHRTARGA